MTAKEYLNQLKTLKYQIRVKRLELKNLHEDMDVIRSPSLGDKVKGGCGQSFEGQVIKAVELENDIKAKTSGKLDCLYEIHNRINSLDDELAVALLTDRYINNRRSDEVAEDLHYTAAYVRRLTGEAVEAFVKKFGNDF